MSSSEPDSPDRVAAGPSTVHGTGVFAIEPIGDGEPIGQYTGRPTDDDGTHVLWIEDDDGGWYGVEGTGVLRFLNHSRDPNVEFDGPTLYARRDIDVGEELRFHYGDAWADVD